MTNFRIVFQPLDDGAQNQYLSAPYVLQQNTMRATVWRAISRHISVSDAEEFARLHALREANRGQEIVVREWQA